MTDCTLSSFDFPSCRKRRVEADFTGGEVTSNGGVLLLRQADRMLGLSASVARRLIDVTYEALVRGVAAVRPGATLGDIGHTIQSFVESNRFSVVRDFCGHGLGRTFHAPPSVMHFGTPNTGTVLEAGMFFTIEPMINAGDYGTKVLGDGWTAVTRDRSLSAQFEHTLAVTDDGFEIFTHSPKGFKKPPYK